MTSMQDFVLKIKPALDAFLRNPTKNNLSGVERELSKFSWSQLQIFHVQLLLPLVLKLEKLNGHDQELQTGTINCIRMVVSKLYLKDVMGLKTMLVILIKQIRDCDNACMKPNLSEEIKLAVVECIAEIFNRCTTDVLEEYYNPESALFLGQILLTLVEFIQKEKYKKLIIASMNCLMTIFYVHDSADLMDVVLRSQVADSLFIFLPKITTVLFKTSLSDEKLGETLITTSIKTLARILAVVFEGTNDALIKTSIDMDSFKELITEMHANLSKNDPSDSEVLGSKRAKDQIEERLKRMQTDGRSQFWFRATSRKLKNIFQQMSILRSHQSARIRYQYAQMCCDLLERCANNLRENFVFMLENVVAMAEDEEERINVLCQQALNSLQCCKSHDSLFDQSAEVLFDEHLTKLPRIISRCEDKEQLAELLFLKGFLRNLSPNKLQTLLSLPRNLEMFCMCLLASADLKVSRDLLVEEYALRVMGESDFEECAKLHWRQFKNLNSKRCVMTLQEICCILGSTPGLNRLIFDYFMEMLTQQCEVMNEIILILIWMAAQGNQNEKNSRRPLVELLLDEILNEKHWHLALEADQMWRLKVDKPTDWFMDRTPGLYESAVEIRMQDCDSDDDNDDDNDQRKNIVTIADAQYNVLHTCIVLDAVAHCATALGEHFENYLFRSLHKVLLKVGSSNSIVYQSANFALISMQKALKFPMTMHFIESYTDYITFHLNRILKRNPESKSAVDILTVVLQFSSRNALPHLDSIFQTIREECSKSYQSQNVISYLKVFMAFLTNVCKWKTTCENDINSIEMQIDVTNETNILSNWLEILNRSTTEDNDQCSKQMSTKSETNEEEMEIDTKATEPQTPDVPQDKDKTEVVLPQYIQVVKDILDQVVKFVSSSIQAYQILSLECLICGIPLLRDYENELLPLVHRLWQPLVERFRQKDAIVLNRCFTLLGVLALYAKEFITKRSLDDVIPFLKQFLKQASVHSQNDTSLAQTQEYKLQVKLLQEFANLAQNLQIEGKQLIEISDVIGLYLSQSQPKELQQLSNNYFKCLRLYNGPLVYLLVLKKSHLKEYRENVEQVLMEFGII